MLSDLLHRLRALLRRTSMERSWTTNWRAHLARQAEKHVRSGLPSEEAGRRACLEFGGLDQVKEECRDAHGVNFIEARFLIGTRTGCSWFSGVTQRGARTAYRYAWLSSTIGRPRTTLLIGPPPSARISTTIGKNIALNGQSHTVVGVMPAAVVTGFATLTLAAAWVKYLRREEEERLDTPLLSMVWITGVHVLIIAEVVWITVPLAFASSNATSLGATR
jgi:hypothetical protein